MFGLDGRSFSPGLVSGADLQRQESKSPRSYVTFKAKFLFGGSVRPDPALQSVQRAPLSNGTNTKTEGQRSKQDKKSSMQTASFSFFPFFPRLHPHPPSIPHSSLILCPLCPPSPSFWQRITDQHTTFSPLPLHDLYFFICVFTIFFLLLLGFLLGL